MYALKRSEIVWYCRASIRFPAPAPTLPTPANRFPTANLSLPTAAKGFTGPAHRVPTPANPFTGPANRFPTPANSFTAAANRFPTTNLPSLVQTFRHWCKPSDVHLAPRPPLLGETGAGGEVTRRNAPGLHQRYAVDSMSY